MVGRVFKTKHVKTKQNLEKIGNAPGKCLGTKASSKTSEIRLTKLTIEPAIDKDVKVAMVVGWLFAVIRYLSVYNVGQLKHV